MHLEISIVANFEDPLDVGQDCLLADLSEVVVQVEVLVLLPKALDCLVTQGVVSEDHGFLVERRLLFGCLK